MVASLVMVAPPKHMTYNDLTMLQFGLWQRGILEAHQRVIYAFGNFRGIDA
jgi:hypothetical protein